MVTVRPYRWRDQPLRSDLVLAAQVNTLDYDGLCWLCDWCAGRTLDDSDFVLALDTEDGPMYAKTGYWVVRGTLGKFTFCDPTLFLATFEPDR
jgi:hypothetical protein